MVAINKSVNGVFSTALLKGRALVSALLSFRTYKRESTEKKIAELHRLIVVPPKFPLLFM